MKMILLTLALTISATSVFAYTEKTEVDSREMIGGAEVVKTYKTIVGNILDLHIIARKSTSNTDRLMTQRVDRGYSLEIENTGVVTLFRDKHPISATVPPADLMKVLWRVASGVDRGCEVSIKVQVEPLEILKIVEGDCR